MYHEELIPLAAQGDRDAIGKLWEANIGLVRMAVKRACGGNAGEVEEWMSAAAERFIICCKNYNPALGYRPSTYFVACIKLDVWGQRRAEMSKIRRESQDILSKQGGEYVTDGRPNLLEQMVDDEAAKVISRLPRSEVLRFVKFFYRAGVELDSRKKIQDVDFPAIAMMRRAGFELKDIAKVYGVNKNSIYISVKTRKSVSQKEGVDV